MNPKHRPGRTTAPLQSMPLSGRPAIEKTARPFLTPGRIAVINGWIIAMLGIVLYCAAMTGGMESGTSVDNDLLQKGWMGKGAIVLLVMGVLLWLYGACTYLQEVEDHPPEDGNSSSF